MSKGTGGLVERPTHAKRNAKRREETYGTFISSSNAQSRDPSFACSSRTTLEDVRDEDTALLAKDTVVKPPKPSSALEYLSPSLRLANIGSVARDHLASERTFLSYVRTSLAISMAGVGTSSVRTRLEKATSILKLSQFSFWSDVSPIC